MIYLWLKIIYYKMIKLLCRKTGAEAGEKSSASRARHEEPETSGEVLAAIEPEAYRVAIDPATRDGLILYGRQAGKSTASTERLRELIDKGLVRYPGEAGDLYRVAALENDRAQREAMAMESGYPGACPCSGRHYPSQFSCRWCRCHDLRNEHHRPGTLGLMQAIPAGWPHPIKPTLNPEMQSIAEDALAVLEKVHRARLRAVCPLAADGAGCSDDSVCAVQGECTAARMLAAAIEASYRPCSVCGVPDHAGVVHGESNSRPLPAEGPGITWPCLNEAGLCPEWQQCDEAGHCVEEPRSAVRPSKEIVCCGVCGHPQHGGNGGRCPGSVSSSDPSGGIESCRCNGAEILQ